MNETEYIRVIVRPKKMILLQTYENKFEEVLAVPLDTAIYIEPKWVGKIPPVFFDIEEIEDNDPQETPNKIKEM